MDMNIPPEETRQTTVLESTTTTNPECCPCDNRSYYEKMKDAARSAASSAKSMGSTAARVGSRAADVAARGTVAGLKGVGKAGLYTLGAVAASPLILADAALRSRGGRKTRRHPGRRHKRKSGKKSRKHRHRRTRRK